MTEELLTTADVAERLKISVRTVRGYTQDPPPGWPKPIKVGSRSVRYLAADINNYINELKKGR